MGGLVKCFLTFKVGYLIKRGAYFETGRNFNIPLLISKIRKCDILSVEMFTSFVSNSQNG